MTKLTISHEEAIELGAHIRAVRKAFGYSKSSDFQKALHFSPSVYYQWELGRRKPSEEDLKKISKHCKINCEWLKSGNGTPFQGIKIKKDTAKEKEALVSYELLTTKLANARKPGQNAIKRTIISYASQEGSALQTNTTYVHIQEELMTKILSELMSLFKTERREPNPKLIAKFASQIYADIMSAEQNPKKQLLLVKAMVITYKRIIK